MSFVLQPWQFLILILAGWINSRQHEAIDYLLTQNRVLREKFGKKRILLNDDQRRRLAIKGKMSFAKTAAALKRLTLRALDPTLPGHDTHNPAAALWDSDYP